jgi:hypothetical protein
MNWDTFDYLYEFLGSEGDKRLTDKESYFWRDRYNKKYIFEVTKEDTTPPTTLYKKVISEEEANNDPDTVLDTIRLELTFLV